jgi:hypothetical protein
MDRSKARNHVDAIGLNNRGYKMRWMTRLGGQQLIVLSPWSETTCAYAAEFGHLVYKAAG